MARNKTPSRAVVNTALLGTPAAVIGGYIAQAAAQKYGIPIEVAGSAIALLAHGFSTFTAWASRGGRKGEAD